MPAPVISVTTPKMMAPAASVVMIGLSPVATITPCITPTTISPATTTIMASGCGHPPPTSATKHTIASIADWPMASETKLPDSVIGVMATATMPTIDALRRMARMLSTVRKLGVMMTATMMPASASPMMTASGSQSQTRPSGRRTAPESLTLASRRFAPAPRPPGA